MSGFDFDDLSPLEVEFKYGGQDYVLREASEAAHVAYQNAIARAVKLGPDRQPVSFDGISGARAVLVAACVFQRIDGGTAAMTEAEVRAWPSKLVKRLFEWVEEASDMGTREGPDAVKAEIAKLQARLERMGGEDPAKNGHSATTPTSTAQGS